MVWEVEETRLLITGTDRLHTDTTVELVTLGLACRLGGMQMNFAGETKPASITKLLDVLRMKLIGWRLL